MKVEADYICEHGMPQPWATCNECMFLPLEQQPVPPKPEPAPKPAAKRSTKASNGAGSKKRAGPRSSKPKVSTALPKSDLDTAPSLFGDKDLAYEVPATSLQYHVQGPESDWLPISSMPVELRERGWIYLKSDQWLVARVRVKKIGYREHRWTHESSEATSDVGPGPTLELDGGNWELIRKDLGPEGDIEVPGYRYLITDPDDTVRVATS